jgi:hypothetical protein
VKSEYITSAIAAAILAACAHHQTVEVSEYHITNTDTRCNGKTACSDVIEAGKCVIFVNATKATEKDYGAAVRKCWEGRV